MEYFQYGETEIQYLKQQDPVLGNAIDRIGYIKRNLSPDPFDALISSIVSQQISKKAADTVWIRLKEKAESITPEKIAKTDVEEIKNCGMSYRKAGYIKGIGKAAIDGSVNFSALHQLSDNEVVKKLSSLHGVGVWTAEMLLIFSLQRPDVVSFRDLGIRRGMMNLYKLTELTQKHFEEYRKRYSPYGSVASLYLWELSKVEKQP